MGLSSRVKIGAIKTAGVLSAAGLIGVGAYSLSQDPERQPGKLEIRNIAPQSLVMSDNPDFYDFSHRRGAVGIGQTATARCTAYAEEGSKGMELFIEHDGAQGYIDVYTAGNKVSPGGEIQVSPGAEVLREQLPDCSDVPSIK